MLRKNLLINIFITLSIGILSFIINKVFADILGKEALGLMSLMTQLISYLNLVDMGITTAATYALYKPLSNSNYKESSIIISTIDSYFKVISIIIILFGSIIALVLPYIANSSTFGNIIYIYWGLYLLNTAWSYLNAKYSILFIANQEYGYMRLISGSSRILAMILQLIALIYFKSFLLFIAVLSLQNIINYIFFKFKLIKDYQWFVNTKDRYSQIKIDMKNMFWHKIGEVVVFSTDYIIISIYLSLKIVAVYATYMIIYSMISTVVNIITPVLAPYTGNFIAKKSLDSSYKLWQKFHSLYVFIATFVVTISYFTINTFVELWMGKEYILSNNIVILILINLYIGISRGALETFKNNTGVYSDIYNPILESTINLLLSLILVNYIGLAGVVVGTVVSNLIVIYILKPLVVFKKSFQKPMKQYILEYSKYTVLTLLSIYFSTTILRYIPTNIDSWSLFIIYFGKVTFVSFVITLIVFLIDNNFKVFLSSLIKKAIKNYD